MKNFCTPQNFTSRRVPCREEGYALMMVIFFTALLLIATTVAAPRILQEGKREKEKEMIWRGRQYVRGVKLYYRKMGRFPTSIDDLTKPKTGSLRFMRQAYKDPMNNEDGSWRLIYVGPAGQLIGSLKPPQTLQLPGAGPGLGTAASTLAGNSTGQQPGGSSAFGGSSSSAFGSSSGFGSFGSSSANGANAAAGSGAPGGAASPTGGGGNAAQSGTQQGGDQRANAQGGGGQGGVPNGGQPGQPGQSGVAISADGSQPASTDASGAASGDAMSTPQAIAPTSTAPIIGGNIIGVGSKISAPSVMVYEKAKNYHLFEFVWDPSKDTTIAGQAPLQTGTGLGQNIGTNPSSFGQQPGATNPGSFGQQPGAPNTNQGQPNLPGIGTPPQTPPLDSAPTPQQ
jgi:hypothetical protein